ncbi:Com family DNA-binding transcriptional regulator [Pseudophaeobacter flagellatus]|uniref:Com family DNA-binding transcriptional regulator n=1 Tax=Pseudophaeobacter flagellatus TaxID=2899119 RepID=UPI0038CD2BFF
MFLQEQRCGECRKLLFKFEPQALSGLLAIKCPRCKAHNVLRPPSPSPKRPPDERKGQEGQNAQIPTNRSPAVAPGRPRKTQGEPL